MVTRLSTVSDISTILERLTPLHARLSIWPDYHAQITGAVRPLLQGMGFTITSLPDQDRSADCTSTKPQQSSGPLALRSPTISAYQERSLPRSRIWEQEASLPSVSAIPGGAYVHYRPVYGLEAPPCSPATAPPLPDEGTASLSIGSLATSRRTQPADKESWIRQYVSKQQNEM
jgi:hypothetical protein